MNVSKTNLWTVKLVNPLTGVRVVGTPIFIVVANSYQDAESKVEKNLDRDLYPKTHHMMSSDGVGFGEMGPDVAYLFC